MSLPFERFMVEAMKLIQYTFTNYRDMITIIPPTIVNAKQEKVVKRTNDGKAHIRPATMTIEVPDSLVKKMKNDDTWSDVIYIVHLRSEALERYASKVVLPGEVQN